MQLASLEGRLIAIVFGRIIDLRFIKFLSGFFPSGSEWRCWDLPSKLTAIGFYLSVLPVFLYCISGIEGFLSRQLTVGSDTFSLKVSNESYLEFESDGIKVSEIKYPAIKYILPNEFLARINEDVKFNVVRFLRPGLLQYDITHEIGIVSPQFISFRIHQYYYYQGAANGNASEFTYNIDPVNKKNIDFFDVFDVRRNAFLGIKTLLLKGVSNQCDSGVFPKTYDDASFVPRFFINKNAVDFVFSEYEVTPGYCGSFIVSIPFQDLQKYIRADGPLGSYVRPSGEWEAGGHFVKGIMSALEKH
ncbi:RsiV family protein [Pseudomonas viridiflava]|uniref:RsiV family protein n=1 Tax=Pseudomonas viridiflava TaxID=33069 RepID=UPI0013CE441E|nr:RsiV family protein [Pseudomonas viridiflava]